MNLDLSASDGVVIHTKVRFKKLTPTAKTPFRANDNDAGYDLYCDSITFDNNADYISLHTGISIELPSNTFGLVAMRSSISNLALGYGLRSSVGIIDAGYRGELISRFTYPDGWNSERVRAELGEWMEMQNNGRVYKIGDRIGQLIVVPFLPIDLVESDELSETDRGTGGWGSSGRG